MKDTSLPLIHRLTEETPATLGSFQQMFNMRLERHAPNWSYSQLSNTDLFRILWVFHPDNSPKSFILCDPTRVLWLEEVKEGLPAVNFYLDCDCLDVVGATDDVPGALKAIFPAGPKIRNEVPHFSLCIERDKTSVSQVTLEHLPKLGVLIDEGA